MQCIWILTTSKLKNVILEFNLYEVLSTPQNENCLITDLYCFQLGEVDGEHYVEIRDGGNENERLIGSYFGSESPGTIVSTGNQLYLKMKTGSTSTTKGFEADYDIGKISSGVINITTIHE